MQYSDHIAPAISTHQGQAYLLDLTAASDEIAMVSRVADEHDKRRMSANTARAYAADWASFEAWCDRLGFSSLPAEPNTVRLYVSDMSMQIRPDGEHRFKVASIERALAAISTRHRNTGNGRHLSHHELVANVMAGIRRGRAERTTPKLPLMLDDVRALVGSMEHTRWPAGVAAARDTFIVLLGFATAMRRSEVASLLCQQIVLEPLDGIHIRLRVTKTDQEGKGSILAVPYGKHPQTCVPCAWTRWTRLLATAKDGRTPALNLVLNTGKPEDWQHVCKGRLPLLPDNQPLLPRVSKAGAIGDKQLTGSALNEIIKRRLTALGYNPDPYGFHSLRAGFVTQVRRNGADTRSVRRQTRHASDSMVDAYDREYLPLQGNAVEVLGL